MACTSFHVFFYYISPTAIFAFFFFNDTATTEIYTLSLHDALPIYLAPRRNAGRRPRPKFSPLSVHSSPQRGSRCGDRKSTRLNSSHGYISYAVFCLKKKKMKQSHIPS